MPLLRMIAGMLLAILIARIRLSRRICQRLPMDYPGSRTLPTMAFLISTTGAALTPIARAERLIRRLQKTGVMNQRGSIDPTDLVLPVNPTDQVHPKKFKNPPGSVNPKKSIALADSMNAVHPAKPTDSMDPDEPGEAMRLGDPKDPAHPVKLTVSVKLTASVNPRTQQIRRNR